LLRKSSRVTIVGAGASDGVILPAEAMSLAAMNVDMVYKEIVFILESFLEIFCVISILYIFMFDMTTVWGGVDNSDQGGTLVQTKKISTIP
jgi:hypothetical protein